MNATIHFTRAFLERGWFGFHVEDAGIVPEFAGVVPDGTPILVGFRRMPAPFPDLRIALPITQDALRGLTEGDPAYVENVEIEFEDAAVRATDNARRTNDPSGRKN